MRKIRTYGDVAAPGAEDVLAQVGEQQARLEARLTSIAHITVVASGKGGVGKSAITANLAAALALDGQRVGAADADLNGPSLAHMLGVSRAGLRVNGDGVEPATGAAGVRVMSMDLLLESVDAPLRWRGPAAPEFLWQSTLEAGTLREFLADVRWGDLDHLLIDAPPGTDKLTRLLQLLPRLDTLLLVTTPSEITRRIVGKSLRLASDFGIARIGLVDNMTAHVCEACGHRAPLFEPGPWTAAEAAGQGPPVMPAPPAEPWAEVPFDRRLAVTTDRGEPFVLRHPDTPAGRAIRGLAGRLNVAQAAVEP